MGIKHTHKVVERRAYDFCIVIRPASIPNAWIGHCLDLDLLSQGGSPEQALEALREAIALSVIADLNDHLEPRDARKSAPEADLNFALAVMSSGQRVQRFESAEHRQYVYVMMAPFAFECVKKKLRSVDRKAMSPVFQQLAA